MPVAVQSITVFSGIAVGFMSTGTLAFLQIPFTSTLMMLNAFARFPSFVSTV